MEDKELQTVGQNPEQQPGEEMTEEEKQEILSVFSEQHLLDQQRNR